MAIIGNDDVVTAGLTTALSWEHEINLTDTIVLAANQQLTELHYRSAKTGGTTSTLNIGIYDVTSGAPSAPLIYQGTINVDDSAAGVYSLTGLTVDLSSHSGKTLAIAHAKASNGGDGHRADLTQPKSSNTTETLADPFVQNTTTGGRWYGIWGVTTAAASGPTITDVNTTNTVQVGDTPIVTGTSFLATGGTQSWGGVSVGFSSWSDTSITSSAITRGDLAYDTNYDWIVTDNLAVASSAVSVQLAIETGYQFVTLSSPVITLVGGVRTSLCYGSVPDCVTGDQLRVPTTTDQGKAIDISAADGTFVITDAGNTTQTFNFEIWDADAATGDKWSASAAVVVNGAIVSGVSRMLRPVLRNVLKTVNKTLFED